MKFKRFGFLLGLFLAAVAFATISGNAPYYNAAVTSTAVRVSAKSIYLSGYNVDNTTNTAVTYLQLFDANATGNVTVGTTAPTMVLTVPANAVLDGLQVSPIAFQNGIVIAATTTRTGSTAPATTIGVTILTQ